MKFKTILLICCMVLFGRISTFSQRGIEVIAFVCGQTDVRDIGVGCTANVNKFKGFLDEVGEQLSIKVTIREFVGANYTYAAITEALNQLDLANPDSTILIFYISGHGFNFPNAPSQFAILGVHPTRKKLLASEFQSMGLSLELEVHPKLLATNARLVMTFGEACNSQIRGLSVPKRLLDLQGLRSMSGSRNERYAELFLETQGDLLSTSSQLGEDSWMDTQENIGGIWTNEFLAAFQKMVTQTQEIDWAKILTETSGQTLASTTKMGTPQHTLSRHTLVNTASECEDCETDIEDEVERKKKDLVVPHVTIKSHRKKH